MGQIYDEIPGEIQQWIADQKLFFVATAPRSDEGHVNCSPKGLDSFRIFDSRRVGYLDLTGSGAETIAHLNENGRIVFMFCELSGTPRIIRLYGKGRVLQTGTREFDEYLPKFEPMSGVRSIIVVDIDRVATSCGYGVAKFEFVGDRTALTNWAEKRTADQIREYHETKNSTSIDGLPALSPGNPNE